MKLNVKVKAPPVYTHEGAVAVRIGAERELRRTVMACMLWEDSFYESGQSVADRIAALVPLVNPEKVANIAIEARSKMKLRHVPLLLAREMVRHQGHKAFVAGLLREIVQRPDELTEFMAIYWKGGKTPIAAQVKKGLAKAMLKFGAYALAKYDRDGAVKLRDVAFLTHPKAGPDVKVGANLAMLVNRDRFPAWTKGGKDGKGKFPVKETYGLGEFSKLPSPGTWENRLSAGEDKRLVFEDLIAKKELGGLALLRNLRNMRDAGVDKSFVARALLETDMSRVLPFRFVAAAAMVPQWEDAIEPAMLKAVESAEKLRGRTGMLVDVSGSMTDRISGKSDMRRIDAACALAVLLREVCEDVRVFSFSDRLAEVPPRRGFALRDAIVSSQPHHGTYLGRALVEAMAIGLEIDRWIVVTDEQTMDTIPAPTGRGYMINVASYKNGVGYGPWTHIDGWSEAIVDYVREFERGETE